MDAAAINRIQSSFDLLAARGPELVDRFYAMLFVRYPALRALFPAELSAQKQKLLSSLSLVIQDVRNPGQSTDLLFEMGRRHARYGVQPAHYRAFRDTLIDLMAEMTGTAWTAQLTRDWRAALDSVSDRMLAGHAATTAHANAQ